MRNLFLYYRKILSALLLKAVAIVVLLEYMHAHPPLSFVTTWRITEGLLTVKQFGGRDKNKIDLIRVVLQEL